jgi:hypothetical protein
LVTTLVPTLVVPPSTLSAALGALELGTKVGRCWVKGPDEEWAKRRKRTAALLA